MFNGWYFLVKIFSFIRFYGTCKEVFNISNRRKMLFRGEPISKALRQCPAACKFPDPSVAKCGFYIFLFRFKHFMTKFYYNIIGVDTFLCRYARICVCNILPNPQTMP